MPEEVAVSGTLVACTSNAYAFADRETGEKIAGTAYAAWIVTDFAADPVKVKIRATDLEAYNKLDDAGPGSVVSAVVTLAAQDNRIVRTLKSCKVEG
jgi:hypothetical protein